MIIKIIKVKNNATRTVYIRSKVCYIKKMSLNIDQIVRDRVNPLTAKLFNRNFHPLKVLSR